MKCRVLSEFSWQKKWIGKDGSEADGNVTAYSVMHFSQDIFPTLFEATQKRDRLPKTRRVPVGADLGVQVRR